MQFTILEARNGWRFHDVEAVLLVERSPGRWRGKIRENASTEVDVDSSESVASRDERGSPVGV